MSVVVVDVATVWASPEAPRDVDAPAVADRPDLAAWTALDAAARRGLHGRTLTQAVHGEPVERVGGAGGERDGWTEVVLPLQPSRTDERGYRGWVRTAHVGERADGALDRSPVLVAQPGDDDAERLIATAGTMLGTRYLWGGTSSWGVDCSGLVHLAHRALGHTVPRDASDQQPVARPVALADAGRGDLYFFAREDGAVYHVGLVTNPPGGTPSMLHAPEGGELVEDVPLPPERLAMLVSAGRLLPS